MLHTDTEARRLLVREHQEALRRDALRVSSVTEPAPVESAGPRRRFRLRRLRLLMHPARSLR